MHILLLYTEKLCGFFVISLSLDVVYFWKGNLL